MILFKRANDGFFVVVDTLLFWEFGSLIPRRRRLEAPMDVLKNGSWSSFVVVRPAYYQSIPPGNGPLKSPNPITVTSHGENRNS
jgi:hypothetical protein